MAQVIELNSEVRAAKDSRAWVYQLVSKFFLGGAATTNPFISFFLYSYKRDKARFTTDYPEYKKGFTPLLNAIRRQQQERGDCEIRLTRRKNLNI